MMGAINKFDDIVDTMIRIMDADGPPPPNKYNKKRRNCADDFFAEHHAEYEARGKQSDDIINKVHQHNDSYPKMNDEINKRKSITKVTSINAKRLTPDFDPNCSACAKLMTLNELKRRNVKPKCAHYNKAPTSKLLNRGRKDDCRSRVTKRKSRKPRIPKKSSSKHYKLSKIWVNRGCQCTSCMSISNRRSAFRNESTHSNNSNNECHILKADDNRPDHLFKSTTNLANDSCSKVNSLGDDEKEPSISNYSSYMSLDHEPMVNP